MDSVLYELFISGGATKESTNRNEDDDNDYGLDKMNLCTLCTLA